MNQGEGMRVCMLTYGHRFDAAASLTSLAAQVKALLLSLLSRFLSAGYLRRLRLKDCVWE